MWVSVIVGVICIIYGIAKLFEDNEKKVSYASFGVGAAFALFSVFSFFIGNNSHGSSTKADINTQSTFQEESRDTLYEDQTETESNQQSPNFTDNKIVGNLEEGQEDKLNYIPEQTGKYRFDFDIDNVNNSYSFYIYDEKENEVASSYSSEDGVSVDLEKGKNYDICIKSIEGNLKYDITIGKPNPVKDITDNIITDKLTYRDQENEYVYIAPVSGIYRFDFDINDVNLNYRLYIYDSKSEELLSRSYSDNGGTIELEKGETYLLKVEQAEGLAEYKISIGVPEEVKEVTDSKIEGQLKFTDQRDVYNYKAPRTGIYRFDFDIDDVSLRYKYTIYDEKKEEIAYAFSSDEGKTVELEKGKTYQIFVEEAEGAAQYTITINVPKSIVTTSGSTINGNINYIDQQNVYNYSVSKTKEYDVDFEIDNVDNSYYVTICDEKNEEVFNAYSSSDTRSVILKKNKKYKIYVTYVNGFVKYKIKIK